MAFLAIARPIVLQGGLLALLLLTSGCSLFDPLIASSNYEVQAEGGASIDVKLDGGDGVGVLRQRDVIHDYMLDLSKDPTRTSAAFDAMLELEDTFLQQGYPLAQVTHKLTKGGRSVVFTIVPGPQVVADLRIRSADAGKELSVSEEELRGYWSRRQTEVLGFGADLYVAGDVEALVKAIESHYRTQGYLEVEVTREGPDPLPGPDTKKVTVTIRIRENARYTTRGYEFDPVVAVSLGPDGPKSSKAGSPFIRREVLNYARSVTQYLRRRGHAEPVIRTTVTPDPSTRTVGVILHGEPGPIVKVARIVIQGNSFVSTGEIRKRIKMEVGKVFDGGQEDESMRRLYQSGLFSKVEISRPAEPGREGEIAVVFDFEETTRYLIEPMIGYGSYEEFRAGVEFEMLAVFGTGFDLNTEGTVSSKGHRVVATLSDSQFWPALLGDDTTLSIAADSFRREEPSFDDGAVGISPALSHRFGRHLSARLAYIFREHGDTRSTVIDPGALIGDYTEGSAVAEVSFDSRDNPLMPRRGTRVTMRFKHFDEALGSDVEFERARITASTVLPVSDSTRFVFRGEAAWVFPGQGSDAVPIQERLFNGGENTVRSFREDQLAPPVLKDVNGQVVGGEYRNIFSAEFRWAPPMQPLRAVELEFALFGDAGNLGKSSGDYGLDDMKYGLGAGLRFLLPIGPVRFDVAKNPDRAPGERDWTFHFSIGYPF